MIVCKRCGHANEDQDDFCGSCGAFLEWEGERVGVEAEPEPEPEVDEPEPEARPGLVTRVKDALRTDDTTHPDEPTDDGGPPSDRQAPAAPPDRVEEASEPATVGSIAEAGADAGPATSGGDDAKVATGEVVMPPGFDDAKVATGEVVMPPGFDDAYADWYRREGHVAHGESPEAFQGAYVAWYQATFPGHDTPDEKGYISGAPGAARPSSVSKLVVPLAPAVAAGAPTKPEPGKRERRPDEQVPRKRKAPTQAPAPKLRPGDLICGNCGTGNDPERRFCRSCGTSLQEAVVVKVPWYRRLIPRRKKKAPVTAGERPPEKAKKGRRSPAMAFWRIAALVMAGGVAIAAFGPWGNPIKGAWNDAYSGVKGLIVPEYELIRPTAVTATSSLEGTDPLMVVDGANNIFWAEGVAGLGEGQGLEFTFAEPIDLAKIIVTSGITRKPEEFVTQPRPREVLFTFSNGETSTVELPDEPEPKTIDLEQDAITTIQMQILSAYPSFTGDATAIAEVEFFEKR